MMAQPGTRRHPAGGCVGRRIPGARPRGRIAGVPAEPVPSRRPLADRGLREPHPDRLAPDHPERTRILAAHAAAMAAEEPGYLDPESGLFVLTAAYLAARGTCCGRGCRHCPYLV